MAPANASSVVKVMFRSGGQSNNDVQLFAGQTLTGAPLAKSAVGFPNGGGRGTAIFQPGEATMQPGQLYTMVLGGGSAPWRLVHDPYPQGQMFLAGGNTLTPVANTDLCMAVDFDGIDGNWTSFLGLGTPDYDFANRAAQSFVAQSDEITHAWLIAGQPAGVRHVAASVGETPDGPAIGPTKVNAAIEEQGIGFAWLRGEVPVTRGKTYWIRFEFQDGGRAVYKRIKDPLNHDPFPGGKMWVDGNQVAGALSARVMGPRTSADGGTPPDGGGQADGGGPTDGGSTGGDGGTPPDGGACASGCADGGETPPDAEGSCHCTAVDGPALLALLGTAALVRRRTRPGRR